jgi:hypothetical protein
VSSEFCLQDPDKLIAEATWAYLRRIFMGKLIPLPEEIREGMADDEPPVEIPPDRECKEFKIIYAIGTK